MRRIDLPSTVSSVRSGCSHVPAAVVAAAGFLLLGAGCGGTGSSTGVAKLATTTTAAATGAARGGSLPGGELAEYASCMRSHGVLNFPQQAAFGSSAAIRTAKGQMAQISQSEVFSPRFQGAQRACAKYYGASGTSTPHVGAEELQKLLAVSRCMRSHGVPNFPDPNPTTGDFTTPAGIDENSPQVLAALQSCRSLGQAAGLRAATRAP
jgi:hypothetical protein